MGDNKISGAITNKKDKDNLFCGVQGIYFLAGLKLALLQS
jgi:hypothetical protein